MKKQEQGRTMLEIVAVLAIMGILSMGGILGYRMAMTKQKANEVMESVSIANQELQLGHMPRFNEIPGVVFGQAEENRFYLTVSVEDQALCRQIKNLASGTWVVMGNCE